MPPRQVLVTYTAHPPGSPHIHQAINAINSHLPLRNLHWKPSNRTSLRTIQELDVRLVELGDAAGGAQGIGASLLERPLVNLCLVVCEDNDTYKNSTRSFIKDWLSLLAARRNEHALIVLVNPPVAGAPKAGGVFGKAGGVLGKLRTDFNIGKKDRCVQVNLPPLGTNDPSVWPETINRLKEAILSAFDAVLLEREEEVKRGEAQRMMVGWNFCSWFLLKESLAISLEGMNLLEDTLIQYDELEASFFQVLKEQNLSWFGKLGAAGPQDDSLPILDWTIKPYRDLIQKSQITIFDFRIYVFARQCELLGRLGRVTEAATKAQWFVASLGRRLRENEAELAENFVESWTYHACLDIVARCDHWAGELAERPGVEVETALAGFDAAKAQVLDTARLQVERIGVVAGHLPKAFPFAPPTSLLPPTDDVLFDGSDGASSVGGDVNSESPTRPMISSRELLEAMADKALFDELYTALTERVLEAYDACGRRRQASRLRGSLAAMEQHNGNYARAFDIYHDLSGLTSLAPKWDEARAYAMSEAINTHRLANLPIDSRWTALALAYLHIESSRPAGYTALGAAADADTTIERLAEVLRALREHAQNLEEDVLVEDHAAFAIRISGTLARPAGDQDGSLLDVEVTNQLPVTISANNVRICFWNNDVDQLWFATGQCDLKPGYNRLTAFCPMVVSGKFKQDVSQIRVGRFNFDYVTPSSASNARDAAKGLTVGLDPEALDVEMQMPLNIALDEPPRIIVKLRTGRNSVTSATLRLQLREDDVKLAIGRAQLLSGAAVLELSSDLLTLGNLEAHSEAEMAIPYGGQPRSDSLNILATLEYTTKSQPKTRRTLRKVRTVIIALPLAVNVQDFFRPECLLSKFTISSDGLASLRVEGVHLEADATTSALDIQPCRGQNSTTSLVTVSHPVSFVYKLSPTGKSNSKKGLLRLAIKYRTISDEIRDALHVLIESLALPNTSKHGAFLHHAISSKLHDERAANDWLDTYLACGELDLGECDRDTWIRDEIKKYSSAQWLEEEEAAVLEKSLRSLVEILDSDAPLDTVNLPWRALHIPVEVPTRSVLAKSKLNLNPTRSLLFEGQAIAATLSLSTSFVWAESDPVALDLSYDVIADSDTWLITGQKRGIFASQEDQTVSVDLLLVPMRYGTLPLPSVIIQPLLHSQPRESTQPESPSCEAYQENAAATVNILPSKGRTAVLVPISRTDDVWERDTPIGGK